MAAPLQLRPERHVVYIGTGASAIEAELDETSWQLVSVVATETSDDDITGWLIGDVDEEMGRVWWIGPFVRGEVWQPLADELLVEARRRLPSNVTEEEMAVDARFDGFEAWAAQHGLAAEPGSWVLTLERDLHAPSDSEAVAYRPMGVADHDEVGRIHDDQFPGTHSTGARLVEQHDSDHPRLVAVSAGTVVGYIAVERQADGAGYIDYLGLEPSHRRRGIGGGLVRAGVAALEAVDARPVHLTEREHSVGARELYASLGFTEERLARPFRRGFGLH